LADVWPEINAKFPNIKLYVIGSGDLYYPDKVFRNKIKNKIGIEEKYEKRIFNILQRNDESVVFTGTLTPSKREKVFEKCGIGVANPSGATETFCLSAVEMQQHGIPVIAAKKFGLKDTIVDKETGILIGSKTGLRKSLEVLIKDEALRLKMGEAAFSQAHRKYNDKKITSYWLSVLNNIDSDTPERISKEIKSINIKSLQALAGLVNKNIVQICGGRWPMLITMWAVLSKITKKAKFK
jgi:glycosyltransferase involved in cell wall biosynthesis